MNPQAHAYHLGPYGPFIEIGARG